MQVGLQGLYRPLTAPAIQTSNANPLSGKHTADIGTHPATRQVRFGYIHDFRAENTVSEIDDALTTHQWDKYAELKAAWDEKGTVDGCLTLSQNAMNALLKALREHAVPENFNAQRINFNEQNLSGITFPQGIQFQRASFHRANLQNAHFDRANLSAAYLTGAYLNNARFTPNTILKGTCLAPDSPPGIGALSLADLNSDAHRIQVISRTDKAFEEILAKFAPAVREAILGSPSEYFALGYRSPASLHIKNPDESPALIYEPGAHIKAPAFMWGKTSGNAPGLYFFSSPEAVAKHLTAMFKKQQGAVPSESALVQVLIPLGNTDRYPSRIVAANSLAGGVQSYRTPELYVVKKQQITLSASH